MKRMKWILIGLIGISLLILGCEQPTGVEPYEVPEIPVDTRTSYLTYSQYTTLLTQLGQESTINEIVIKQKITDMNIKPADFSIYVSGEYVCYSLDWNAFSSYTYDWIYYISVNIWTTNGQLNSSMCSYYSD